MNRQVPPFELVVDRGSLAAVYAPRPKVIIPAVDVDAAEALGLRGPFDTLVFHAPRPGGAAALRVTSSPATLEAPTPLETAPGGSCLFLALTERGRAELQPLEAWWQAMSPSGPGERLQVDGDCPEVRELVFRRLLELSEREALALARRGTELYAQLGALREEYETLDREKRALQARLEGIQASGRNLASIALPAAGHSVGHESGGIVQPLPVSSEGLARIDLHLAGEIPPTQVSDGSLEMVLRSADDGRVLGRWRANGGELLPGWFRCELPRVGLMSHHHLELAVAWDRESARGLRLSLAEPDPFQDFIARTRTGERLGGLLAMALWTELPGATPTESRSAVSVEDGPVFGVEPWIEYELSPSDFARVVPTTPRVPEYCRPLEGGRGLLLHPIGGSLAEARIPSACPPGTDRVVASVRVANPAAASPVEFAMLASEAGCHRRLPSDPCGAKSVLGFSGWVVASTGGTPCVLGVQLAEPTKGWADLLLATRIAPGASNAYCWAEWNVLRVRLSRRSRG